MEESYKEVMRGEGYGDSLELIEGVIIPRVEELPSARYVIKEEYKDYTKLHSVNPILYEVFQEGDTATLMDDERWKNHKEFLFDLLYLRDVRGINPLPRTHAHYSFVQKEGYIGYDDLTELIVKYFGILSVTEQACKETAQQFQAYCANREHETEPDDSQSDPYYAEIYDIYLTLMNDAYEVGKADMVLLKRYVTFLKCERQYLPTFLKTYLYDDYPWEKEPLFMRGKGDYSIAVGELQNLLHALEGVEGININYDAHETALLKQLWYSSRSASDAIVFLAVREHAILQTYDKVMSYVSKGRTKSIALCMRLVSILQKKRELFAPFMPAIEELMQKHHPFLRKIYTKPHLDICSN